MMWVRWASKAVLITGLAACNASQQGPSQQGPSQQGNAKPATQAPKNAAEDTVFKDTVGTMDKARAVQDTADQHRQQLDQALQQAEGEPAQKQ